DLRDAALDLEPRRFEGAGEQGGRTLFLVAGLGPLPDLVGHLPGSVGAFLDGLGKGGFLGVRGDGEEQGDADGRQDGTHGRSRGCGRATEGHYPTTPAPSLNRGGP